MIKSQSICKIYGRIASINDLKYAGDANIPWLQFSLAVDQSRKKEDGEYTDDPPLYFDCVSFGKQATQLAKYVALYKEAVGSIGMGVAVEGQVTVDPTEKDGVKQKRFSIKVYSILAANLPRKLEGGQIVSGSVVKPLAKATLSGHISATKRWNKDKKYLQFSLAVDRSRRKEDGSYEELPPYFFDLVAFGKMGERLDRYITEYQKVTGGIGMEIIVSTTISPDVYTKNGIRNYALAFKVEDLLYANVPRKGSGKPISASSETTAPGVPVTEDEDEEDKLPFD